MRVLALLAVGLVAAAVTAEDKKEGKSPKDEEAILGTWKVVEFEIGSAAGLTAEQIGMMRMTFGKGGKLVLGGPDGKGKEVAFKMDPTAQPKAIDLTSDEKGQDEVGLYALDGDALTLVLAKGGSKIRPTEFKTDAKAGITVFKLKRVKDEKNEGDAILGMWSLEKVEAFVKDGKDGAVDSLSKASITFSKEGRAVEVDAKGKQREGTYKADPTARPKALDLTLDKATTLGVYEIDGDTLRVCVRPKDPKARPAECKADADGAVLMTWRRVKEEKKDK